MYSFKRPSFKCDSIQFACVMEELTTSGLSSWSEFESVSVSIISGVSACLIFKPCSGDTCLNLRLTSLRSNRSLPVLCFVNIFPWLFYIQHDPNFFIHKCAKHSVSVKSIFITHNSTLLYLQVFSESLFEFYSWSSFRNQVTDVA